MRNGGKGFCMRGGIWPIRDFRADSAYSLVELLVTIGLAAILIAPVVPAMRKSTEAARLVRCTHNQSGNGTSAVAYALDHEGQFPPFFLAFSPGTSGNIVVMVQPRKAREAGIDAFEAQELVCPSDEYRDTVPVETDNGQVVPVTMSYGYNIALSLSGQKYTQVPDPTGTLLLYDGSMSGKGAKGKNIQGRYRGPFEFVAASLFRRHDERLTAVFVAGQVEVIDDVREDMADLLP